MDFSSAFEALGGRKFFGFVVTASLLSVVSVYAKLDPELAYSLVALYVSFVGGNAFNTLQAMKLGPKEQQQQATFDSAPLYQDMQLIQDQINQLTKNQAEFVDIVTRNMDVLGKKVQAVITLKG
jgi:uncharacterized membrane-anchored protein